MPDDRPSALPTGITVLGLGQMGLVCALLAASSREAEAGRMPAIHMWGHDADEAGCLAQLRTTNRLPEFRLPPGVDVALDDREAMHPGGRPADLIVSAIPVQFMRSAWQRLRPHVPPGASVVSVAKGIENSTLMRPTQIIADVLKDDPDRRPRSLGCLSGPSIAVELARGLPGAMVAATEHQGFGERLQMLFSTRWLRIYTHEDLLGVELAGATKNVIALAAGVLDGLNAGDNAKSALFARGLAEICRLGAAMGANKDTFMGIAGTGDLATTCFSPSGRNRACGEALGRGVKLEDYLARSTSVVEGVATTRSVVDLCRRYRVEMPITEAVHEVLFGGIDPVEAIGRLMQRELKEERIG